jgi:hypothetical protein
MLFQINPEAACQNLQQAEIGFFLIPRRGDQLDVEPTQWVAILILFSVFGS